jgi:tetratricopeptide (TPR) repeat protein
VTGASERYLRLTKLAQRAFAHGRLERALSLFSAAEGEAKRAGDRELTDRAFCNRCVVLLELDRLDGAVGELKTVLMRARDPFTAWMAAYYTAQVYEAEGNVARALAYARRASEQAETCGERRARKGSANLHGVLALRDSHFGEAAEHFRMALQLAGEDGEDDEINLAVARDNLGYCLMCTGQVGEGAALCGDAAAALESLGTRQLLPEVYQDLCYGALQQGRFDEARGWGEKALALAREFEHPTVARNTLMLLADAAMDLEDEAAAEGYLQALAEHYPDFRGMKSFLRAFNVRDVINLKA